MKKTLLILTAIIVLTACDSKKKEYNMAMERLSVAKQLTDDGKWNAAKLQIDSIHILYAGQVEVRREAKALNDSIIYLEALRTAAYSDSVLQILMPLVDKEVKQFRYEKSEKYEDHGKYVHRLLSTGNNINRSFIQAYLTDDFRTIVKCYYYGKSKLGLESVLFSAGENMLRLSGPTHQFESEGWHEILTLEGDDALSALNFVATWWQQKNKVTLEGKSQYHFFLSDNERKALQETWQLAVHMNDSHRLEQQLNVANRQIEHFADRHR